MNTPTYLTKYEDLYQENPRAANQRWFSEANLGLFLHYGLYSMLGRHEWVQLREKIRVAEYEKLAERFTAENFDAEKIAGFAEECGIRYVNLTTRHHDSFCLWESAETPFHSVNSAAGRDLVKELYDACVRHGIGLFLYYSHGRDWRHPHAPNNDTWGGRARPEYDPPESAYAYGSDHDLQRYLDFMTRQITELLTRFPDVAGIWLDGIGVVVSGDYSVFKCQELYDHIHSTSPHALVSYKQGLLGTEDFFTPEHFIPGSEDDQNKQGKITSVKRKVEINTTMIYDPISWGWQPNAKHKSADQLLEQYRAATAAGANLLVNTGPLPDGSLDPIDVERIREAAARIVTGAKPQDRTDRDTAREWNESPRYR